MKEIEILICFNPLVTNGLSHPYHLDRSIFIFREIRSDFSFLFHLSMKMMSANKIAMEHIHAVQTLSRIRTGGSPIMPTSARERDKLQCKQNMDKYTCQVKAVLIISS